jgi:hypothetical protein
MSCGKMLRDARGIVIVPFEPMNRCPILCGFCNAATCMAEISGHIHDKAKTDVRHHRILAAEDPFDE